MASSSLLPGPVDFDAVWSQKCERQLNSLFIDNEDDGKTPAVSASSIYNAIYHLSVATPNDFLVEVYSKICGIFLNQALGMRESIVSRERNHVENCLCSYATNWRIYSRAVKRIDGLCMYVNKVIEKLRDESLPELADVVLLNGDRMEVPLKPIRIMALHIWKRVIVEYIREDLGNLLLKDILESIEILRTRKKHSVDIQDLEAAIKSFDECDPMEFVGPVLAETSSGDPKSNGLTLLKKHVTIYDSYIEIPFIKATQDFYTKESQEKISSMEITNYIRYAENRIREEIQIAKTILPLSSLSKVTDTVEYNLITAHCSQLQKDFTQLLEADMKQEIILVNKLLDRTGGVEPLANCFKDYLVQEAQKKLLNIKEQFQPDGTPNQPNTLVCPTFVYEFAKLWQRGHSLLHGTFIYGPIFQTAFDEGMRRSLELQPPCTPHDTGRLLAEFFDMYLQNLIDASKYVLESSDGRPIPFHQAALDLLHHLEEKDSFIYEYAKDLSKRLLFRLSHNGKLETQLVHAIGLEFGGEHCVRIQKMLRDVHFSHQLKGHFENYLRERSTSLPFGLMVHVPSYIVWPIDQTMPPSDPSCKLPADLEMITKQYTMFYRKLWFNRHLTWLHHLSRVTFNHAGAKGRIVEITATIPQANVLLLFQQCDKVSAQDMMAAAGVNWLQFTSLMKPIFTHGLLTCSDPTPTVKSVFSFNPDWTHMKSKLRLCRQTLGPSIELSPNAGNDPTIIPMLVDNESSDGELSENRKYSLQALIVKLLKLNKELSPIRLSQLVVEAASNADAFSSTPTPHNIKSTLDVLEDKQYIEYDQPKDLYIYIP